MAKKTTTKPDSLSNDTETKRKTVKSKKENDAKVEFTVTEKDKNTFNAKHLIYGRKTTKTSKG